MKKCFIAALALLLCLTACGQGESGTPAAGTRAIASQPAAPSPASCEEPDPVSVWTIAEGITASLLQDAYPAGTKTLTMVLENRTDLELTYGEALAFHKYVDGQWQDATREDAAWHDIARILQPHSTGTFSISTGALAQPLDEGLYRITSEEMWIEPDKTVPGFQVEFRVASGAQPEPDYPLYIPGQPVSGEDPIPIRFLNTTGEDAYVLDIPHLERLDGAGDWVEVPYREQAGFCGTPSTLPAGGREWSEDTAMLWGVLEPGQYRLSYEAGTTFETEGTASGKFTVAAPELCALPLAPGAQD